MSHQKHKDECAECKELETKIAALESESVERLAGWQRSRADYQNLKRETDERLTRVMQDAKISFLKEILPIYEQLRQATLTHPDEAHVASWIDGIDRIRQQFESVWKKWGVTSVPTVGQPFDPHVHEAVQSLSPEGDEVVQELEAGYMTQDRLIYPAKVIVGPDNNNENN